VCNKTVTSAVPSLRGRSTTVPVAVVPSETLRLPRSVDSLRLHSRPRRASRNRVAPRRGEGRETIRLGEKKSWMGRVLALWLYELLLLCPHATVAAIRYKAAQTTRLGMHLRLGICDCRSCFLLQNLLFESVDDRFPPD